MLTKKIFGEVMFCGSAVLYYYGFSCYNFGGSVIYRFACEDCDFCYRLRAVGRHVLHCAGAKAFHVHSSRRKDVLRRAFAYGYGWTYFSNRIKRSVFMQLVYWFINLVMLVPWTVVWPVYLWDIAFLYNYYYFAGKTKSIFSLVRFLSIGRKPADLSCAFYGRTDGV